MAARVRIIDRSPVYETDPWGITEQPRFLNMVVSGFTDLKPLALLRFLKGLERSLGRKRGIRYGPRVIDLDILFYDDRVFDSEDLTLPHPRLIERRFVLVPLAAISPHLVHPVAKTTVAELLSLLPDDGSVRLYRPPTQ